jgi:hypothetical protein
MKKLVVIGLLSLGLGSLANAGDTNNYWHLKGAVSDISVSDIKGDIVWIFKNGDWYGYSKNELLKEKIEKKYAIIKDIIKKGDGYWVYNKNPEPTTDSSTGSTGGSTGSTGSTNNNQTEQNTTQENNQAQENNQTETNNQTQTEETNTSSSQSFEGTLFAAYYNGNDTSYYVFYDKNNDANPTNDGQDSQAKCLSYKLNENPAESGWISKIDGKPVKMAIKSSVSLDSCSGTEAETAKTYVCFKPDDSEPVTIDNVSAPCEKGVKIGYVTEKLKANDTISVKFDNEVKTYTIK